MDVDRARRAVAQGLAFPCATCEHYWRAADRGEAACGQPCRGPLRGGAFESYQGPVEDFTRWCLRCGGEASRAIRAAGASRAFGVCAAHEGFFLTLRPEAGDSAVLEVLSPVRVIPAEALRRRPNPVLQILGELEAERRDEDPR